MAFLHHLRPLFGHFASGCLRCVPLESPWLRVPRLLRLDVRYGLGFVVVVLVEVVVDVVVVAVALPGTRCTAVCCVVRCVALFELTSREIVKKLTFHFAESQRANKEHLDFKTLTFPVL